MMEEYKEILLGPNAISYIRERLSDGHALAKALLSELDLEQGIAFTSFQANIDEERIKHLFEQGGVLPQPPPEQHILYEGGRAVPIPHEDQILIDSIQRFLNKNEGRLCVFEDALRKPTDPSFRSVKNQYFIYNDEIYYYLSSKDINPVKIKQVISNAFNFYPGLIGIMTKLLEKENFIHEGARETIGQIRALSRNTEKIVISAYDGEGYLFWKRK